jgi:hypothetical protein
MSSTLSGLRVFQKNSSCERGLNQFKVVFGIDLTISSDVSFRFYGNRLLEKGTSTMSLGDFYDYYNHPARRELWLSKSIPLWKNVKGQILHLEVNINMTTVSLT